MAESDEQLQALIPLEVVREAYGRLRSSSYQEVIDSALSAYSERPALGARKYKIGKDPDTGRSSRILLPAFRTVSYEELHDCVKRLAATWQNHAQHRVLPGDFVCILGSTGIDFTIVDLATAYVQAVSVPLQAMLDNDLSSVFATTAPTAVAATIEDLVTAAELAVAHPSIRSVIAFDYDAGVETEKEQYEAARALLADRSTNAGLITLDDMLAYSMADAWTPPPRSPDGVERMALLVHSSGSTGQPKGVIQPERLAIKIWAPQPSAPVVRLAYAPMNHMMGRGMIFQSLCRGGTSYVTARPDLSEFFDDIALVRPTELALLPRLMEVIHRRFLAEVARRSGDQETDQAIRAQVMAEMRTSVLGDRICALSSASAALPPEVMEFITECFELPISESYGMTEAGGITINGRVMRPPVIDYQLRDVPELGYFITDKPYPRGELFVKTETATPGYFKQPEATAKLFDEDGFMRTGDIMEERAPDRLVYLERVNDVMKLSQGEFIAIGTLGGIFETFCPTIEQMYLYGNSTRAFLLAVIVPDMTYATRHLDAEPDEDTLRALIRKEIQEAAAAKNLRPVDVPRDFIIELEPFSFENGLLTSVRKRKRPALKAKYGERLEQLYDAIEQEQDAELRVLYDDDQMSVEEKLAKALKASLGIDGALSNPTLSFADLGGDSLGAVTFATLLSEIFKVEISTNMILSPAGNLQKWARFIERALGDDTDAMPTFSRIHGEQPEELHAKDLDIGEFLDVGVLDNAPLDPPGGETRCALLTGATGYLGRFLCLEWLQRFEGTSGKLICLIRAADEKVAFERLSSGFATDPALAKRFSELSEKHLEILIGDIAEPYLGVGQATFDRLAEEVDHIVHCGALVNHVLAYEELFDPNVAGTAQLVRLALTHRQKIFDYISTIAVAAFLEPGQRLTEKASLLRTVQLTKAHGRGYSTSKWAGEQILHSANRRFGLPVNIFRCNMILADRRYDGQINVSDSFTRLLYSILMTESAPKSFYELTPDGNRQAAHYDGLPVDFVATAITDIGTATPQRAIRTFHVLNPHIDDGISTDVFIDWMEEAGYRIQREANYGKWLERFQAKLQALPEEQRQCSVLPVIASVRAPMAVHRGGNEIDSTDFVEAVSHLPIQRVPQLDRSVIFKYLGDLQLLGLLAEPASKIA